MRKKVTVGQIRRKRVTRSTILIREYEYPTHQIRSSITIGMVKDHAIYFHPWVADVFLSHFIERIKRRFLERGVQYGDVIVTSCSITRFLSVNITSNKLETEEEAIARVAKREKYRSTIAARRETRRRYEVGLVVKRAKKLGLKVIDETDKENY